ncbi:MAG: alpha/beta hydrolase [Acidiferrobacteraceae bacterium]
MRSRGRSSSSEAARTLAAILVCLVCTGCTAPFFQPMRGYPLTPALIGLPYRTIRFRSGHDLLTGWFLPAAGCARGSVLFVHGNGQDLSTQIGSVYWLPAQHYNVFAFDYQGYGTSTGAPTLSEGVADVGQALRVLKHLPGVDPRRIVVFGQSLGGAFAVYALAHLKHPRGVRALVIEGAFADYREIARQTLARFWLTWMFQWPLSLAVPDRFSPVRAIPKVAPIPVLIIDSVHDEVVPVINAYQLYHAARAPKTLWIVHHGGHIQAFNELKHRLTLVTDLKSWLGPSSCRGAQRRRARPVTMGIRAGRQ